VFDYAVYGRNTLGAIATNVRATGYGSAFGNVG
jgi:hypothetical protein